jgi:hypothetical protein
MVPTVDQLLRSMAALLVEKTLACEKAAMLEQQLAGVQVELANATATIEAMHSEAAHASTPTGAD